MGPGCFELPPDLLCLAADGALLESSSRRLISSTLKNFHLLTILAVTAEDLGVYTCSMRNALGTAATTAVLRKAGGWASPGLLCGDREATPGYHHLPGVSNGADRLSS